VPPGGYGPPGGYVPPPGGYVPPPPFGGHPYPPPGFRPPPPAVSPGGQPLAEFGQRLGAFLIDALVFAVAAMAVILPAVVIFVLAWVPSIEESATVEGYEALEALIPLLLLEAGVGVVLLGMAYVYYVEMMFRTGQTLGKRVMKLRVVPMDPAARLDRRRAAKRYLAQHIGGTFIPGFSYVDGFWQLWDKPYRQCLHDKFAQTTVVQVTAP
jgi:uncharacterized RDD family membrane protein YckC